MRNLFFTLLSFLIIYPLTSFGQCQWVGPIRITNGYIDKNPAFYIANGYGGPPPNYEYLAFERYSGSVSKICVLKMGLTLPTDTPITIVSNNFINRNPAIAYSIGNQINKAFVIWETNKNGRWDIYASIYTNPQGWSLPFPVDTTSQYNKYNPQLYFYDTSRIDIVYERNNSIIYRKCINGIVQAETNLTINETLNCRKPYIAEKSSYYSVAQLIVTYEKIISSNQKAINFITKPDTSVIWSIPDTVAFVGINNNIGFSPPPICCLFESNRRGNWNLYCTEVYDNNSKSQFESVINLNASNLELVTTIFPLPIFYSPPSQSFAYVKKFYDSTQIVYGYNIPYPSNTPIYLGDTSKSTKLAINTGINAGYETFRVWIVYSKDSSSYTNLYAIYNTICMDVKKIGTDIPTKYSLYQNYPNPFNPSTKIKFSLPYPSKGGELSLIIYDVLGRKVASLIPPLWGGQEGLAPGTYEVEWDATNYPSGVYFYKLTATGGTETFVETKKMMLLK